MGREESLGGMELSGSRGAAQAKISVSADPELHSTRVRASPRLALADG